MGEIVSGIESKRKGHQDNISDGGMILLSVIKTRRWRCNHAEKYLIHFLFSYITSYSEVWTKQIKRKQVSEVSRCWRLCVYFSKRQSLAKIPNFDGKLGLEIWVDSIMWRRRKLLLQLLCPWKLFWLAGQPVGFINIMWILELYFFF